MLRRLFIALLVSMPLIAAAQQAAGSGQEGSSGEGENVITPAIQGVPKIFLPDIGIAGDFAFQRDNISKPDPRYNLAQEQPNIRDGQLVAFSPIDPFTIAQFTIDLPAGGAANIEEAWLQFSKLPGDMAVRLGRFIPQFGLI